ncbi:MAG: DMT family transporter [Rhodobacter sp.]|nr:DMT family transporter [Rhodobacter sp.]
MVASMAGFAVEDAFLKASARHLPLGQVMIVMGLCGMAVFAAMSLRRGERPLPRGVLAPMMLARSASEIAGRLFYTLAVALTPLSSASAILQATPLVVIAGAALLFRERVGAARWLAVALGFLGVLMILRPGAEGFSALSFLAVAGTLGFAGRDLATRAAPVALSNRQLGALGFAMLAVAGALILAWTGRAHWPDARVAGLVLGATTFGIAGYYALTAAMRTGEISAVTPFRYMRLVCALILAAVVFGERPDGWTLAGAALIVGAGIFGLSRRS